MSDFLSKLNESLDKSKSEFNYFTVQTAITSLVLQGEYPIVEIHDSPNFLCNHNNKDMDAIHQYVEHAIDDDEHLSDDEIRFVLDNLATSKTDQSIKFVDCKPEKVSIAVIEKGSIQSHIMFRKSGKSMTRKWDSESYNSSSVNYIAAAMHRLLNTSGTKAEMTLANDFRDFKRKIESERRHRLENYPELSGNFWGDIHTLFDYCDNYSEFHELVEATSVHSMNDRHLSRLSRATIAFDEDVMDQLASGRVYRAVPVDVDDIEAGDWVTFSEDYAECHANEMREYGEEYHVISLDVEEGLYMLTDQNEYVFLPQDLWGGSSSLKEVWDNLNVDACKPTRYPSVEKMFESTQTKQKNTIKPKI